MDSEAKATLGDFVNITTKDPLKEAKKAKMNELVEVILKAQSQIIDAM